MRFDQFFTAATGIETGPFEYQCRLACGERKQSESVSDWLRHGADCQSKLLDIPDRIRQNSRRRFGVGRIPVLSLSTLVRLKHAANRDQDRIDLDNLRLLYPKEISNE